MIELSNVKKQYRGRTVLDIGALTFRQGGRYAVIGPNGSGKTTLLRILAGALAADEGTITMPESLRVDMGYMPQHPYAFDFSVRRNVQIAFKDQKAGRQPALAALRKVGMESLAAVKGNRLSGGETQRMALARMIAKPRGLLLLDEPTSATDIAGNDLIENALADYYSETGCTLIFATHSPAQAQTLAGQILMLDGGVVVEAGPADQVLLAPQSAITQAFLRHWQLQPAQDRP